MKTRMLDPCLLAMAGTLLGVGLLGDAAPASAQAPERQWAQAVPKRPYVVRFDAAYRQRKGGPAWIDYPRYGPGTPYDLNGSTGYGGYNRGYFYGGSGNGQYSQSYFYGDTNNRGLDLDGDGVSDQTDPDIDGDGVQNTQDRFPRDRRRS